MSLKEDVNYLKKEISAEESYIENFFKIEKLFKKYKKVIITIITIIIVAVIGFYVSSYITQQNKIHANIAFNTLLENPNDQEAMAILKVKNQKLYDILQFQIDDTKEIDVAYFKELAQYSNAIKENNIDKLNSVTQKQGFLLKDFALFNKALIQTQNKKYIDARETLRLINDKSEVSPMANMLQHFLLTK
jgi:PIN domain nuclease of toxin-antitoxin system